MGNTVMCDATVKITVKSRLNHKGEKITVDLAPILVGVMLIATTVAAVEYYRQVRKAQKEYEKARDFVEDIVLSFNRELRRESDRFESMVSKVEGSHAKADSSFRKIENVEKKIAPFEQRLGELGQAYQTLSQTFTQNFAENTQNNTTLLSSLESKLKDIEGTQDSLKNRITGFEEQIQKLSVAHLQEVKTEITLPPIPIKRDKALAALTETEIGVLEMLSKEGAKTAPEIKERVHLSREHTARLMKKLYEQGYLERESDNIPFRYSIKKEMEALLQKIENPTPSSG
jgi:DNA-binding MarR family transcriptional regulator